ncbi:UPF0182 family membrane protein [Modestobacter sp. VKM Ac-2985]|uniref:UPF0182 family membrane protein n=1 Tax=Modestobacter sp. VKM Ac-2985 TaxID=3004139 RepID=UPI0022AB9BA8|nr:UPF0182 family protein [Modestobacter sp. VKM Ac-2985]MCZ2838697.1 UPF0182 family protein [Modestobacter sp. VKM Ac-2985]
MRPPVPVPTLSRRAKLVIGVVAVLLVLFTVIGTLTNAYVDYLWFDETGFTEVFWTEIQTRALLFAVAAVATGGLVALAVYLAYRFRPTFRPMSLEQQNLERYRQSVEPRRKLVLTGIGVGLGLFAGITAQGSWQTWLTYRNSTDFGTVDPQFGLDISFFVFDYPFYRLLLGFGFAIVLLALIGSVLTHYVFGGLRLQTPGQKLTGAARVQLSVLVGVFVALKAVAYWLDRYELVYSNRGEVFSGASYTDLNALLPAKNILVGVAAICAIAFFANILVRNTLLPAAALVLLLASSLVIGVAYPAIVQQFVVNPSANQREAPYIERAIAATRDAYGLDDVEYVNYAQDTAGDPNVDAVLSELRNDDQTIPNARLLDPNVLSDTFTARQQIRNVYGFPEKLDIDRYTIDGQTQDYVVAVRELNSDGLSENQDSWINRHTVYTHGNGFVAAPANQVTAGREGGEPNFTTGNLPTTGNIPVDQSRVYYGELMSDYSVVGAPEGVPPREFDQPEGGSDEGQINNTYDGDGGIAAGSFFRQLTFAIFYRERNFLLSEAVNEESKVLHVRNPRDRVQKAAPFLEVDGDPYPAVIDGRIVWILDGYTTSDSYPYAEQMELGEAATDALTGTGTTALPNETFNYIRNSVKATVDAYDGSVTLYEWESDPVLQTYMKAFPGVVEPRDSMGEELEGHMRYPEDLFKVQREILTRYHVDDPVDFYNQNDRWQIPDDPTQDTTQDQPPYYILAQRPGDEQASFQLTSPMNAFERQNLSAFISASSAPETYGEIQVLQLPGNTPFRGPGQVQNAFETNNLIRPDLTLFNSDSSTAVFGNLLTLPIGDEGLLYVEPLYVRSSGEGGFPLLQKVLVNFGDRIGYANTLSEALDQVFGAGAGESATDSNDIADTVGEDATPEVVPGAEDDEATDGTTDVPDGAIGGGTPGTPEMADAVSDINAALEALQTAQQGGDFAGQGAALEDLQVAVEAYQAAQAAAEASPGG